MKIKYLVTAIAATALITACAYVPPNEGNMRRVSPDYNATGNVEGVRAFVQGAHTIVELNGEQPFVSIRDEVGASVDYERVGRYIRITRHLDTFTAWINGRSITFSAPVTTRVFSASKTAAKSEPVMIAMAPPAPLVDAELVALLKLSQQQLAEVRKLLEVANKNPSNNGGDLFEVQARLDEIEKRLAAAPAAMVSTSFPTGSTKFKPTPEAARTLIATAKSADRVLVRGHTDAKIAGSMDAKIAQGRADAARKFLVDNGVDEKKISVSSKAEGEFIAPNTTKAGRALNRRVEIEIATARLANLQGKAVKLAAAQQ